MWIDAAVIVGLMAGWVLCVGFIVRFLRPQTVKMYLIKRMVRYIFTLQRPLIKLYQRFMVGLAFLYVLAGGATFLGLAILERPPGSVPLLLIGVSLWVALLIPLSKIDRNATKMEMWVIKHQVRQIFLLQRPLGQWLLKLVLPFFLIYATVSFVTLGYMYVAP